jgi:hypothetical protein
MKCEDMVRSNFNGIQEKYQDNMSAGSTVTHEYKPLSH